MLLLTVNASLVPSGETARFPHVCRPAGWLVISPPLTMVSGVTEPELVRLKLRIQTCLSLRFAEMAWYST